MPGPVCSRRTIPVEQFQLELREICGLFDVEPQGSARAIVGSARVKQLGRLEIAQINHNASCISRGSHHIKRDSGENYFAIIQLSGQSSIDQENHMTVLRPGEICIVDSSQPAQFRYHGGQSQQLSFHLPRAEMRSRFGEAFNAWTHLGKAKSWYPPLIEIAKRAVASREENACRHLEESFLSLLGAAFIEMSGTTRTAEQKDNAILQRACRSIDLKHRDPGFSPAVLAKELGVSARTLQRHFQALDDTPSRRLLRTRLNTAHNQLISANLHPGGTVTDIAYRAGFSDLSHFYREFKRLYGATPGVFLSRS